jgi:hypothetical protein
MVKRRIDAYNRAMQRLLLVLLLTVVSAGCLRSTTTIDLRPDGGGTIVTETGMSTQALAMMKGLASTNQTGTGATPTEFFGEEQARKTAEAMGVTFVSGEPFKTAELEGYRARYSFDDISKIKVNMEQSATSMAGSGAEAKQPPFSFGFDRKPASSLLTIQIPEQLPGAPGQLPTLGGAGSSEAEKAQAAQAMAMMKMMMKGMFIDVSLNLNGRLLKSNAPYVDGSKVTLIQIDFDKLLADESALQKLQGAKDLKSMAAVPGFKIVSDPKITIEFAR